MKNTLTLVYEKAAGYAKTASSKFEQFLRRQQQRALQKNIFISDSFIQDLAQFAQRNAVVEEDIAARYNLKHLACPQCVAAHTLLAIERHNLPEESHVFLKPLFQNTQIGHNGYYEDNNQIIRFVNLYSWNQ